jgi:hypothetical protein
MVRERLWVSPELAEAIVNESRMLGMTALLSEINA